MANYLLKRLIGSPLRALKTVLSLALLYTLLLLVAFPYDTPHRDRLLFQLSRPFVPTPAATDNWLVSSAAAHPVNWTTDVGIIVKTGYGTQARVQAWLDAARNVESEVVLIADFATKPGQEFWHQGKKLEVHDVVGSMVAEGSLSGKDLTTSRVSKYLSLDRAVKAANLMRAEDLSQEFGWELDAMKVCLVTMKICLVPMLIFLLVHSRRRAGLEEDAGQELVPPAGRRHIHCPTIPVSSPGSSEP